MGSWSIRIFRIFGIELEIHVTFLLLWALFAVAGWSEGGLLGVIWISALLFLVFTCVVLHELGHSLTARHYGIEVPRILLMPIGGMAQFERIPRNPRQEIIISLAGPAVNLGIACLILPFITWPLRWPGESDLLLDRASVIQFLLMINIVMALFNLLPIFPMDGGRILRAALAMRFPYLQATTIATWLAKALAIIGAAIAIFHLKNPLLLFLFAFIFFGGDMEHRLVRRQEKLSGLFVRDLTRNHYQSISSDQTLAEAAALFKAFRPGELLVMDGDRPCGYLTSRIIRDATKQGRLDEPVTNHCIRKFSVLQAGWPLDPFAEMIAQSQQRLYPVYSFGDMIGVVDTKNLENLIAWHRLKSQAERRMQARFRPKDDQEDRHELHD